MKSHEKYHGARHRALILMYIGWLTLSLTPAMVAPPERSFQQGQPEMQQSMDNMVTRENIIKKRSSSFSSDGGDYKDINFKTSNLLAEAEKVLKNLPDSKERQWMEAFVVRVKEIASILQKTAQQQNLPKNYESVKGKPVPDGLSQLPTKPPTSAVPEFKPFQKPISMISKIQMTSPEISKVLPNNDDHSELQAVTKPVASSHNVEETEIDELVRELESLHEKNTHQVPAKVELKDNAKVVNQAQTVTTTSIPFFTESNHATLANEVAEKTKQKLIEQIAEFHQMGGVIPKEVLDILYEDSQKLTDSVKHQNIKIDEEMKFTESGMKDRQGAIRLDDLPNENKEITMENFKSMPYHAGQQFHYLKFNQTFQNRHPNLVQAFPRQTGYNFQNNLPLNKAQPYQGHLQNTNQNLQKMNPQNLGKHHDLNMLYQQGPIPDVSKQKFSKPQMFFHGRLPSADYNNYFMRHSYGPYPYMHNWKPQNLTIHLPQMMPPYVTNQEKIDTQLSDEMKRELRDGKIIVLSDSVVRSNFKPENNEKTIPSITQKPESQKMDMKNVTMTGN